MLLKKQLKIWISKELSKEISKIPDLREASLKKWRRIRLSKSNLLRLFKEGRAQVILLGALNLQLKKDKKWSLKERKLSIFMTTKVLLI